MGKLRIIDLFSGVGGLTFGFYYKLIGDKFIKTNNKFIFANEVSIYAASAYRKNYPDIKLFNDDIRNISNEQITQLIGEKEVDIVIGGPPCQSFSTIGKRQYDDKAKLFWEYLRILKVAKPKLFLFENVKGLLSMREKEYKLDADGNIKTTKKRIGHISTKERIIEIPVIDCYGDKIINIIKEAFGNISDELGYDITIQTINACDFGVPQNRERVIILGVRKDLGKLFKGFNIPKMPKLTIADAISDLPVVREGESVSFYTQEPTTEYQKILRGDTKVLDNHFCGQYGDKIRTVIRNVKPGEGRMQFNKLVLDGKIDKKYYLTSGFANTYGRLEENKPSTTITNNLSTPSGLRCIHYSQNRALTPREGARIQSFPDWFRFEGPKCEITKQIGNAVPPMLALALAEQIIRFIGR